MPYKHFAETVLILILALLIMATGVVIDTLPLLPEGTVPWGITIAIAVLYPLLLYPSFRRNRADYSFRLLHFIPAVLLLIWFLIQLIAIRAPQFLNVHHWYTWGWTGGAVIIAFFLLAVFCLQVIRRRVPRILFLLLLLIPFTVSGVMSERSYDWDSALSAQLWRGTWWDVVSTGTFVAQVPTNTRTGSGDAQFPHSADPEEEAWREKLRQVEEKKKVAGKVNVKDQVAQKSVAGSSGVATATGTGKELKEAKTAPVRLPKSGPVLSTFALAFIAAYCCVVHRRAVLRG
ncbi:MAG: hypothetical protein Q7R81_04220 [Candidatus Peregrinibacteria bacterium]|nr:hypothetical protein [Candidatus Peregrinibacteria bacterium]